MVKEKAKSGHIFAKTVFKLIKEHYIRFLLNLAIVFVSISLTAGIGALDNSYTPGFASNYQKDTVPDVILKYVPEEGETTLWTEERIDKVKNIEGVNKINKVISFDVKDEKYENYRLLVFEDLKENGGVGLPKLKAGKIPDTEMTIDGGSYTFQSLLLEGIHGERNHQLNEKIPLSFTFSGIELTLYTEIVGTASNTLYTSKQKERGASEEVFYLNNVYFSSLDVFGAFASFLTTTDLYVTLNHKHNYLTNEYKNEINSYKNKIEQVFGKSVKVLTLEDNTSYALYKEYSFKVNAIAFVLPFFFIAVCALVVVVIISRLITEERSSIACCFSLGVRPRKIYGKYLIYSMLSSLIGVVGGYILGCYFLPILIYRAYQACFHIPYRTFTLFSPVGLITGGLILFFSFLVTFYSISKCLKEKPADLLKAKAPKAGKKILLEKVPLIWNRISFSFKSSIRNIFRYKKNLLLTSLSIIGSTTLIFLGLGLRECAEDAKKSIMFENVAGSIGFISAVIVLYGVVLSSLIIYSLVSMNIDQREREIAVLKVLGYRDFECAMFIFRELFMITIVSALLGIPVSMLASHVAFSFLDFGSLKSITWVTYVLTYAIIIVSTVISSFILYRKIYKIDFNVSLKSLE